MSGIAVAMSGMRAAAARLEVSAENLVAQPTRGALPGPDSTPPLNPQATPAPKVYRPIRANLHSLDHSSGGGVGVRYRPIDPGYYAVHDPSAPFADEDGMVAAPQIDPAGEMAEQIQASAHYRASLKAMQQRHDLDKGVLDVLA